MKSKIPYLAILLILPFSVFSKDIRLEARREFDTCMRETKKYREQCDSGGCGNAVGACYERQINKISEATASLENKSDSEQCMQARHSAFNEIEIINSKFKSFNILSSTWRGYEVQVEVALLKNFVANALAKECEIEH